MLREIIVLDDVKLKIDDKYIKIYEEYVGPFREHTPSYLLTTSYGNNTREEIKQFSKSQMIQGIIDGILEESETFIVAPLVLEQIRIFQEKK